MLAKNTMTAYEESWITREMTITHFSTMKANGHFFPFNLGYFLDLTHKGKKSVLFPPCLHSILNVSVSSFTYSCIKVEFVEPCSSLISLSHLMWVDHVILNIHRFYTAITLAALFLQQDCLCFNQQYTILLTSLKDI